MLPNGTLQERRHQLVHRDATNAAPKHMTEDVHVKIVRETCRSKNEEQYAVECKYVHNVVNSCQIIRQHQVGLCRELCDQYIFALNGKPPRSMKAFVYTVRQLEHHDVIHSGFLDNGFRYQHPQEWTRYTLITSEEATDAYMVEVVVDSPCNKQQLISCRLLKCLLRWQGNEVVYSRNCLTCARG